MARLSAWQDGKHTKDYRFIDRHVYDQFTRGGTGFVLHKYLGPVENTGDVSATKPANESTAVTNIQDLLFLENRDRKYDTDLYTLRGVYTRSDSDFSLSQFGLFLGTSGVFVTFHYNAMLDAVGRKIMNGDVLEFQHLIDHDPLDANNIAASLKRYYVVSDTSWPAEGFSRTWFPHLWRCKVTPIVDSQEYKDILNNIKVQTNNGPMGTVDGETPLGEIISTFQKYIDVNEAIIQQADEDLPLSGYDVSALYNKPLNEDGSIADISTDPVPSPDKTIEAWLSGDGLAPNGLAVTAGTAFPDNPTKGDYFLRLDFLPNRLFRFSGSSWKKIEDSVRTNLTPGNANNKTIRNSFANNENSTARADGTQMPERQSLSKALRPPADY